MSEIEKEESEAKPAPPTGSAWENRTTAVGVVTAVLGLLALIASIITETVNPAGNPYRGIWSFMAVPTILVAGLLLIPLGWYLEYNRRRKLFPEIHDWQRFPRIDFNNPFHRKLAEIFVVGTLIIIPVIGIATYEGYHYTDSTQFCGQVCHSVMQPEYTAYMGSPHARVSCAACHIGPGANWFVKAKISGIRQVFATVLNTYARPVPTPIRDLRPARETCEQCHWPAKFFGSQLRTRFHYAPDERNTRRENIIVIKTGGGDSSNGPAFGIHWHMALSNRIEYIATDESRQRIAWVRSSSLATGRSVVYRSDGKGENDPPPPGEMRLMDCVDCHNRPTHQLHSPDRAINVSMETGRLDPKLPYLKKMGVQALVGQFASDEEADAGIEKTLREFYSKNYPDVARMHAASIDQAVSELRVIYRRNFFPDMRSDWRKYPDNIGHMTFDGCFRCHDDRHLDGAGRALTKECTVCHDFAVKAVGSDGLPGFAPMKPDHPVKLLGVHSTLNCSRCHTGGPGPETTCAGCHVETREFREGKAPLLPAMKETPPTVMAELDCDSCHDLEKPQTAAEIGRQCEVCHEAGYADMLQAWREEAEASRSKARTALDDFRKSSGWDSARADASLRRLVEQMEDAMARVERVGAQHNTDLADAVYQRVVTLSKEGLEKTTSK